MKNVGKKIVTVVLGILMFVVLGIVCSGCQGKITAEYQGFYPNENGPQNNIYKSRTWSIGNFGKED
ncbi:MAG TPA: hypothetical protein VMZ91_10350 [Candidatus Paceibacterota bacterium]|nr:hypothetical protein [Candidatus Paceibacterota bacterium]